MKKLILAFVMVCFLSTSALAAWSVYTVQYVGTYSWRSDTEMILYRVTGTSDAGASGDLLLSTGLATYHGATEGATHWKRMQGGVLYAVEYVPGAATPTTAAQITIDTADGTLLFDETVATAATGEMFRGDVDQEFFPPLTDLIFVSTTLANTKTATFNVWIMK